MKKTFTSLILIMILSIIFVPVSLARDGTLMKKENQSVEKVMFTPVVIRKETFKSELKNTFTIFTEKETLTPYLTADRAGSILTFDGYYEPPEKIPNGILHLLVNTNRIREPTN